MFAQSLNYPQGSLSSKYKLLHIFPIVLFISGILCIPLIPGQTTKSQREQSHNNSVGLDQTELAQINRAVSATGYYFSWHAPDQKYETLYVGASNRENDWYVTFTSNGIKVNPYSDGDWEWGLQLHAYGYVHSMQSVASPKLKHLNESLTLEWDQNISEWWINSSAGLEQGFTIWEKPNLIQEDNDTPLILEMGIRGNLIPLLSDGSIQFHKKDGETILVYDQIHVTDSLGNVIPATLNLGAEAQYIVKLEIDDSWAKYPITVDPWIQSAKLNASDGAASDFFGWSVAISGDTVVVGAPFDNGAAGSAYVFTRSTSGWQNMIQTAKLTASDAFASDQFGYSVAINGDTIVVGAPFDDDNGSSSGSTYVFVRPLAGWSTSTETAKLTASDGGANDNLGISVGISGNTVVAGAYRDGGSGSAYVFTRPSTGWSSRTEVAKLTPSDGTTNDYFGRSTAVAGDTIVIGAYLDDDNGSASGSAYVFVRSSGGWISGNQTAKITASDGNTNDNFGRSVAVSEDIVVVGANLDDTPPRSDSGSAYLFVRPTGGWSDMTQTAKITASDPANSDQFGFSVAVSGDLVIVGAPYDDDQGSDSGSAYVFVRPTTGWANMNQTDKQTASDGAAFDYYGYSVAVSEDTAVVGSNSDDDLGSESGSAYVFQNSFCTKQSGFWGDTSIWVGGVVPSLTSDVCISTNHVVTLGANAATNRLLVAPNAVLDIATYTLSAEDNVKNHGTLEQSRTVDGSISVSFLDIQNNTNNSTQYRGITIDPTGNNQNLGLTSVSLRETLDWFSWHDGAGIDISLYCTATSDGSPNYTQRCFTITPNLDPTQSVRVRLWGLSDELNGISEGDLSVYRNSIGGTWVELTTNRGVGNDGENYSYAEGDTADFSAFLLGETGGGNSPTAITIRTFAAKNVGDYSVILLSITLTLSLGILITIWRRQVSSG